MDPSQANFREYQRQAIDESILALRYRHNALAPISSLPTEVIAAIFSFLRVPVASSLLTLGKKPDHLPWLRVAHVCHHWRDIALKQPLFWSHVNFTAFSMTGAAEILTRAKAVPLYLEARVPARHWDDARFSAFQKELQARASHICHLSFSAEYLHLRKTLEALVSPAPTLEYLSLSREEGHNATPSQVSIPETLFDGTTPRLSRLELQNYAISWKSPLLKGLTYLDIRSPSAAARPSLSVWLDALDEIPRLETLTLHSASPIAPTGVTLPSDVDRTISLPSLEHLEISSTARDCGLALAHLDLPALTQLCLTATSRCLDNSDLQEMLPYFSRHVHGLQHNQPLQSVVDGSDTMCANMLAWTVPDNVKLTDPVVLFDSPALAFSFESEFRSPETITEVFDAAMAALPLDRLVTLTSPNRLSLFDEQICLRHARRWPLLQCLRLGPSAAGAFREMLLEDNGGHESPLLPSLKKIDLVESALSARRTLRLCDVLTKRVEQGVPLETLDLHTCIATSRAVELLSEIVVDVLGPDIIIEGRSPITGSSTWDSAARGYFVEDDTSELEDEDEDEDEDNYGEDNLGYDDSEEWDNLEADDDWIEYCVYGI